jgi:pimeloyl-ACP methyl ester carboxylesterase
LACDVETNTELSEAEAISVGKKIVREQDDLMRRIVNEKVEAERKRIEEKYIGQIKSLQTSLDRLQGQSPAESRMHLVILVHGINTRAPWMDEVKATLRDAGFQVASTSFGLMSVRRFLAPQFLGLRKKALDRLVDDIRMAKAVFKENMGSDPKQLSVIAHSFGTFAIAAILREHSEFRWHKIIFCGSVVSEDFPFGQVLDRFDVPLVNEVGTRDYYPALAESAGWGYGSVGSHGFNRPPVETRWHYGFKHSDFLTQKFCNEFWVPLLRGAAVKPVDAATKMPRRIRVLIALRLRWLILFLLCSLVALIAWEVWNLSSIRYLS